MTKFLVIIFLIVVLSALVLLHFRKQIQTALYVLRMFRQMRRANQPQAEKTIETKEKPGGGQLIRCARCGTWIPETSAMKLGAKTFYCSANCIENAVPK
jgi:hypothetical protein